MTAQQVFEKASHGGATDFSQVIGACRAAGPYCLIGGLAVNCYVEPVYTMDADLVIAASSISEIKDRLQSQGFTLKEQAHSLNAQAEGSQLRIQLTTDPRYQAFLPRAQKREVLGENVMVACLEDIIQGKLWAYQDPHHRPTKAKKDELDLLRLAEAYPDLQKKLPSQIVAQLKGPSLRP